MNRKTVVALAIFVSIGTAAAAGRSTSAFPLKIGAFKAGFRNCSRPTPQGITSFWQVSQSDVKWIDEALMQYLERTQLVKELRTPPSAYGRQYLGYNRGERRFVYVNAFMRSSGDAKSTYVRWCDGGNQFWGIEYDMQQRIFTGFYIDDVEGDPLEGLKL